MEKKKIIKDDKRDRQYMRMTQIMHSISPVDLLAGIS